MPQPAVRAAVLLLFITGLASRLPAQTDPEFVVSLSPSIVTVTQGGAASLPFISPSMSGPALNSVCPACPRA